MFGWVLKAGILLMCIILERFRVDFCVIKMGKRFKGVCKKPFDSRRIRVRKCEKKFVKFSRQWTRAPRQQCAWKLPLKFRGGAPSLSAPESPAPSFFHRLYRPSSFEVYFHFFVILITLNYINHYEIFHIMKPNSWIHNSNS